MRRAFVTPLFVLTACAVSTVLLALPQGTTPPVAVAPASPQGPPTFRAESNIIEVDALPTDKSGRFVGDLTRDEFVIEEDGKPQPLSVFSLVDLPVTPDPPPVGAAAHATPIDPDVVTNAMPLEGRVYLLVLDAQHVSPLRTVRVKQEASDFVEHFMTSADVAGVVHMSDGRANQEFTSSKARLLASIDSFAGDALESVTKRFNDDALEKAAIWEMPPPRVDPGPACDPDDAQRASIARADMRQLEDLARAFGGVTGRRKALLLFSQGLEYELMDRDPGAKCGTMLYARDTGGVRDAMSSFMRTASINNVNVYTIDPRGLTTGQEDAGMIGRVPGDPKYAPNPPITVQLADETTRSQDSLRTFAEETGGRAFVNKNDLGDAFKTIVADSSRYYLLGYSSPDAAHTGKYHRISVKVKRTGIDVAARQGYYAADDRPTKAPPAAPPPDPITGVLLTPMPVAGLGMRVNAVVSRNTTKLPETAPASANGKGAKTTQTSRSGTAGKPSKNGKSAAGPVPQAAVRLTVEFDGTDLRFDDSGGVSSDDIAIAYRAFDTTGAAQALGTQVLHLNLKPDTKRAVVADGLRYATDFAIAPGHYQLRVAAREVDSGHAGSVFYDLDVPDFSKGHVTAGGLTLSSTHADGLVTGEAGKTGLTGAVGSASTLRAFEPGDALTSSVAIYVNAGAAPTVALHVRVLAADGREVFAQDDSRDTADVARDPAGYTYQVSVPAATLGPGRYVLRVTIASGSEPPLVRTTEFRVR